jgi:hypothetical protein
VLAWDAEEEKEEEDAPEQDDQDFGSREAE